MAEMRDIDQVLAIGDLSLSFLSRNAPVEALSGISLDIGGGEIVGLVGESGSGKSVTAMSILRLLPETTMRFGAGSRIVVLGRDVVPMAEPKLRAMRGRDVSMVFQEPMTALNPVLRIRRQMLEVMLRHQDITRATAERQALDLLGDMQIADPARVLASYPHELSGGMRQRVTIAMAFSCNPKLIIADEATTALDVTVQAKILQLLRDRAQATGTAVLLITHDLAVVGALCHRTYVMYKGRIVESGPTADIIHHPRHAYTRALLNALPDGKKPRTRLETVAAAMLEDGSAPTQGSAAPKSVAPAIRPTPSGAPFLEVRDITVRYPHAYDALGRPKDFQTAVDRVSLILSEGETVSIVGESGCGKTSFANALIGLVPIDGGDVLYRGTDLKNASNAARREIQIVFQDPMSSLDPRWPIWRTMTEPMTVGASVSPKARRDAARDLSDIVGLDPSAIERLPHEFSGGQRQRVAIARALSVEPRLLILDEPTSALDVSVQAQILNLLLDLQDAHGLAYLFISHNMSVVRHMSDRIAVMLGGRIVEHGPAEQIIAAPRNDYTKNLLAAAPQLNAGETS